MCSWFCEITSFRVFFIQMSFLQLNHVSDGNGLSVVLLSPMNNKDIRCLINQSYNTITQQCIVTKKQEQNLYNNYNGKHASWMRISQLLPVKRHCLYFFNFHKEKISVVFFYTIFYAFDIFIRWLQTQLPLIFLPWQVVRSSYGFYPRYIPQLHWLELHRRKRNYCVVSLSSKLPKRT